MKGIAAAQKGTLLLFEDQFEREDAPEAPALPEWDEGVEALKYVDLSVSFASVCERFAAFAAERGLSLGLRGARKLLSAFCASQLIVLRGASTATAPRLAAILSEFFGSRPYLHELSPQERLGGGEIASGQLSDGSPALSNAVNAFRDAALNRHIVHVAAWTSASAEQIAGAIRSYEAYFTHPERAGRAGRFESGSTDCSALSPNVWFFFTLSGDSSGDGSVKLPLACLIDAEFQAVDGSSAREPFEALNYYQLTALSRTCGRDFCLDENACWRKLDRLEQAVGDARSCRIDHGTWLRLERFSSVFLACGGEQADAFDCAVAAVLLPRMLAVPEQSLGELAHLFEEVFGSDYMPECKKVLAGSSAANSMGR